MKFNALCKYDEQDISNRCLTLQPAAVQLKNNSYDLMFHEGGKIIQVGNNCT